MCLPFFISVRRRRRGRSFLSMRKWKTDKTKASKRASSSLQSPSWNMRNIGNTHRALLVLNRRHEMKDDWRGGPAFYFRDNLAKYGPVLSDLAAFACWQPVASFGRMWGYYSGSGHWYASGGTVTPLSPAEFRPACRLGRSTRFVSFFSDDWFSFNVNSSCRQNWMGMTELCTEILNVVDWLSSFGIYI